MYISFWPCISSGTCLKGSAQKQLPFPFSARHQRSFYVARNAIYHLFRALAFRPGENVLVPNYHSGNEVSAIRAAGTAIVYYPIRRNFQPDLEALERLCMPSTRALYVIHFAGWPQPMKELSAFCRQRGLLLIEDCALALLSEVAGKPLGSFGDYAVYCLYKTLPLPNGGLLVENGPPLKALQEVALRLPDRLSVAGRGCELALESLRSRMSGLGGALAALKRLTGQALSALSVDRVPVGNIGFDIAKVNTGMSPLCARLLPHFDFEAVRRRRRANYLRLREKLAGLPGLLPLELREGVCPLFFPILADDKRAAAEAFWRRGIGVVELWNEGDPAADGPGSEDALFLRKHVLELPIHQAVTPAQLEYLAGEAIHILGRAGFGFGRLPRAPVAAMEGASPLSAVAQLGGNE